MTLSDLTQHAGEWLRGAGPMHDVVISSRIRLARNIIGMPFLSKCTDQQKHELERRIREKIFSLPLNSELFYVDLKAAGETDRQLLVERHLISRQHAGAAHARGVAVNKQETLAIMVNEEDHLRIQVFRSGLQMQDLFEQINQVDDALEESLGFAFHNRYGYLTACPTNVGTALRISVMLHLPALKMTGEIDKVFRAARDMHLAVRGLYGEGTEAGGDFFQFSNQTTLGKSEHQILREFLDEAVPQFLDYERRARQGLLKNRPIELDDKIFRAVAILKSARTISSEETIYLLSLLRLGIHLGRTEGISTETINELFLLTQPAHLQRILQREMDPAQRGQARANYIRNRLAHN